MYNIIRDNHAYLFISFSKQRKLVKKDWQARTMHSTNERSQERLEKRHWSASFACQAKLKERGRGRDLNCDGSCEGYAVPPGPARGCSSASFSHFQLLGNSSCAQPKVNSEITTIEPVRRFFLPMPSLWVKEIECTRLAMATFWRTFHHDGKISPAWCGWGVHTHPLSLYLPLRTKL